MANPKSAQMARQQRIFLGAMSGTSADGVDIAAVAVEGHGVRMHARLILHHHRPYPRDLRQRIFAVRNQRATRLTDLAEAGRLISLSYATAANEAMLAANLDPSQIQAIAAHGQTLFHAPPSTIQWIDPALLAHDTGCPVVSDFRRADCAVGGQGAPLVPFADYILFRHPTKNRVLLNIGGIANLTYVPAGGNIKQLIAFDTGPGNCVMDDLMRRHDPEGPGFDAAGQVARRGKAITTLLDTFTEAGYFRQPPPKSTDGPAMIDLFENARKRCRRHATIQDLLATACAATVGTILGAMKQFLPEPPAEIIVSGGGTNNTTLMKQLAAAAGIPVSTSDAHGVPSPAKEAMAFALLAAATLDGVPSNVPSCTGAQRAVLLGSITPRQEKAEDHG